MASAYLSRGNGSGISTPMQRLENVGGQPLDDAEDVVHLDERHFQVELRELRLAVGTQVLVAQAAGDLEILVVAGHHEQSACKAAATAAGRTSCPAMTRLGTR